MGGMHLMLHETGKLSQLVSVYQTRLAEAGEGSAGVHLSQAVTHGRVYPKGIEGLSVGSTIVCHTSRCTTSNGSPWYGFRSRTFG
mmetsp:Transcript_78476/g.138679  ORF Transcript_78476/g.138679 Transcript_78476/m.138679 type:complete len:85 (+) Transcript_78476:1176-1430(+)